MPPPTAPGNDDQPEDRDEPKNGTNGKGGKAGKGDKKPDPDREKARAERQRQKAEIAESAALTVEAEAERRRADAILDFVMDKLLADHKGDRTAQAILTMVARAKRAIRMGEKAEVFVLEQSER